MLIYKGGPIGCYLTRDQFRQHGVDSMFGPKGFGAALLATDGTFVEVPAARVPPPLLWDTLDQWGEMLHSLNEIFTCCDDNCVLGLSACCD